MQKFGSEMQSSHGLRMAVKIVSGLNGTLAGEAKVGQLEMPILGDQEVVRLEVTMHNPLHSTQPMIIRC